MSGGQDDPSEKPRHGVASKNPAPHSGIDEPNSTLAIGFRASLVLNGVGQSERARYYSSNDARWMTPDWSSAPEAVPYADLTDPQSLNLYSYVGNNPLSSSDSDGHVQVCGATTVSTDANGDTVVHANCRNVQVDTSFATRVQNAWDSFQNFINSQPIPYVPGVNSLGAPACACMQNSNQQQNNNGQDQQTEATGGEKPTTLQSGNTNTIKKATAKALNKHFGEELQPREWGRALESLKREHDLPNNFHGKIMSNGDFAGEVNGELTKIGNIGDYIP